MKKLIGLLFLCALLLQVAGSYVYFIVRLTGIRQEMRAQLKNKPDEELTLLTFSAEEFRKVSVDDHEVKVSGKMYDIARIVSREDHVLLYVVHDEAEDNLLVLLNEMVQRSAKDKKPVPSQLLQLLSLLFLPVDHELLTPGIEIINHSTSYLFSQDSTSPTIDGPPPRG